AGGGVYADGGRFGLLLGRECSFGRFRLLFDRELASGGFGFRPEGRRELSFWRLSTWALRAPCCCCLRSCLCSCRRPCLGCCFSCLGGLSAARFCAQFKRSLCAKDGTANAAPIPSATKLPANWILSLISLTSADSGWNHSRRRSAPAAATPSAAQNPKSHHNLPGPACSD